jgi:4-azaleucine resistance transporter AzlC
MAATIFAGSLEFIMANMLTGAFAPVTAFVMGLVVNARHIFYGIAMLDRYRTAGAIKSYLIYGLVDETFSMLGTGYLPDGVNRRWFYFWVTLFNECYWVFSTAAGAFCSEGIPFDTRGIEFVLPALFLSIFAGSWQQEQNHICSVGGLTVTFICLLIFGSTYFLLAAMACIVCLLLIFQQKLKQTVGSQA